MTMRKANEIQATNTTFDVGYLIEDQDYTIAFYAFIMKAGLDETCSTGYENETFVIRPYDWSDKPEAEKLPNFEFKPEGIKIQWYKNPLRDAFCNTNLSVKEFKEMLRRCYASMQ